MLAALRASSVASRFEAMHSRGLQLPDRRASGSADRIERQARPRLASVALDLKPSEPAVEALSNGRRRLRWAAIGFHPDRPQFGGGAIDKVGDMKRKGPLGRR